MCKMSLHRQNTVGILTQATLEYMLVLVFLSVTLESDTAQGQYSHPNDASSSHSRALPWKQVCNLVRTVFTIDEGFKRGYV